MSEMNEALLRDALLYADRWLAFQQKLLEIPALSVAARFRNTLLLSAAYGHANLEDRTPVTPGHIFRVASHSKWFTATAVMQLVEGGKLRLDDALGDTIGWLPESLTRVTIRAVLNHAAGIVRDGYDNDHWQLEHPFPDAGELRTLVERGGAVLAPNRMFKYSNIGFGLLGEVIEAASAMPYNDYMREKVVHPLGLESTGPETTEDAQSRMVTGYTSRALLLPRLPLPDIPTGALSPATGFYSTAEDLTRFAAAHFIGNDELLNDDSKREMQRPYWPVTDIDSYGLGMIVMAVGDRRVVGHSGGFPGHTTRTVLDPNAGFTISILTSESGGVAGDLMKGVVRLIDLALEGNAEGSESHLDLYTGRFVSLWGYSDVVRFGDRLFNIPPSSKDPTADATRLEPIDENSLRIEEKEGYGSPGELVTYERDAEGTIRKVVMAGSTQYPEGEHEAYLRRRRAEISG